MRALIRVLRYVVVCVAMITITSIVSAQSTTGTIFGAVVDSTGAAIPGATVTLTDVRTAVKQTTTTNGQGEYTYANVKPSEYTVASSATGFKTLTQTGIAVAANQNVHVPFTLPTGQVSESVEVEAGVTLVDTREAQLGETIDQEKIENLPTLNRDVYSLVLTTPGVTNYTADSPIGTRGGVMFSVNGLAADQVSYYLDGAYDNDFNSNGGNKIPNPDALSEFRVLTSNFDAEFGRSPAAVINAITRSGTDRFHGAAYDYFRNNILNARNYFVSATAPTVQLQQNQFGARLGGPAKLLPQTFFFLDYQGTVQRTQSVVNAGSAQTLTALERTGNFTGDTFGTAGTFKVPKLPAGANCGTATNPIICNGTNYKGGPLGSARNFLDPVVQNVLQFVPVGAPIGSAAGVHTIGQQQAKADSISNEGTLRFDFNHFKNHAIEAMFFYTKGNDTAPGAGGNQIYGYGGATDVEAVFNVVAADVWTINDKTVNSFRAFTSRNHYTIFNEYNQTAQSLGSTLQPGGALSAPPRFNLNGYVDIGGGPHGPANVNQVQYGGVDTVNLTRGRHSLKVGGSYVYDKLFNLAAISSGGNFTFTGSLTGNTFADFLLGSANSLAQSNVVQHNDHSFDPALYAQDDWQITRRFNLNLGVRWEVFAPFLGDNTFGTFAPGVQSTVVPNAPVGLLYEGDAGIPQGLYNTSYLDFAPRVGFAYDVYGDGKTSVRGGFGLFYAEQNGMNSNGQTNTPYGLATTTNQTPNLVCPYGGTATTCPVGTPAGTDPYPYNPATPDFFNPTGGSTINAIPPNGGSTPYVYEYNLTVEQQLTPRTALHVAYVGNALRKQYITIDENAPVYVPGAAVSAAGILLRRPYEPYNRLTTGTGFRFGAINLNEPSNNGQYNSLQVTLRGRFSKSLQTFASYVWSKSLNYGGPTVDNQDIRLNYGVDPADLRHRFVVSYLYELPTTRRFGLFGREILSGWRANGITAFQSGSPFQITSGVDTNLDGTNNDRVNVISSIANLGHLSRAQKIQFGTLNPAAFSVPSDPNNPYGNEQKFQFFGPANINTDLSLFKEFALFEQARFQFRAESFNVFGNVNLNNPRTGLTNLQTAGLPQITAAGPPRRIQFAAKIIF